jgi:hypothetical protein
MKKSSARSPKLTQSEIDEFFRRHIPYRLGLLRSWTERVRLYEKRPLRVVYFGFSVNDQLIRNLGNYGDVLDCSFESALLSCRMFMEFLGLKASSGKMPSLVASTDYTWEDDVKVVDLGGTFVAPNSLGRGEADMLVRSYVGAGKATAHLTCGSGHGFNGDSLHEVSDIILCLINEHLYRATGRPSCIRI